LHKANVLSEYAFSFSWLNFSWSSALILGGSDKAVAAAVKELFYALNEKYCCDAHFPGASERAHH
jgi:hypothetical protein